VRLFIEVGRGLFGTTLSFNFKRVLTFESLRSESEEAVICACDNSKMDATDLLCTSARAFIFIENFVFSFCLFILFIIYYFILPRRTPLNI
jgi:hypothetical protein